MADDRAYQRLAFKVFADFSGTIAVPAVLSALLGKWLDERLGSGPWMLILFLVAALILTAIIVVRKAKYYGKQYQDLDKKI